MNPNDPTLQYVIGILVTVATSTTASIVISALFERRNKRATAQKIEADYADQISKTAMTLVDPLKAEVGRLTTRVNRLERQVGRYAQRVIYLMGGIDQLLRQVDSLGHRPVWIPDEWIPDKECEEDLK